MVWTERFVLVYLIDREFMVDVRAGSLAWIGHRPPEPEVGGSKPYQKESD